MPKKKSYDAAFKVSRVEENTNRGAAKKCFCGLMSDKEVEREKGGIGKYTRHQQNR